MEKNLNDEALESYIDILLSIQLQLRDPSISAKAVDELLLTESFIKKYLDNPAVEEEPSFILSSGTPLNDSLPIVSLLVMAIFFVALGVRIFYLKG